MHLAHSSLRGVAPFGELEASFCDEHGEPRPVTVVHGGAGVGKTTLLQALACTRPGHATVLPGLATTDDAFSAAVADLHRVLLEDPPAVPLYWQRTSRASESSPRSPMALPPP